MHAPRATPPRRDEPATPSVPRIGIGCVVGPRRPSRRRGWVFLAIGLLILLGGTGDVAGEGLVPLLRLLFAAILVTSGGSLLVPASGRTAILGWALRIARLVCYLVAVAVLLVWFWRR